MNIDKYDQSKFLVLKAAYLYFISGLSQYEISTELGVSVTTVSRLLKKAKNDHIIEFVIRDPLVDCLRLEKDLKRRLGLKEVVIAPVVSSGGIDMEYSESDVKKLVALEGARYLQRIIKDDDVLGCTWGSTVYEMINYLNPAQKVEAQFVTLHGSLENCNTELDVRVLVSRIARAFSGRRYALLTDVLMDSEKTVASLKKETSVARIYEIFKKVTIAVFGIGSLRPLEDTILTSPGFLSDKDISELRDANAVGDIGLRFFDEDGNECDTSLKNRTLAIDWECFKRVPGKVLMASGIRKAYAVLCAARGGMCDVLIIDSNLAEKILEMIDEEETQDAPGGLQPDARHE